MASAAIEASAQYVLNPEERKSRRRVMSTRSPQEIMRRHRLSKETPVGSTEHHRTRRIRAVSLDRGGKPLHLYLERGQCHSTDSCHAFFRRRDPRRSILDGPKYPLHCTPAPHTLVSFQQKRAKLRIKAREGSTGQLATVPLP